MQLFAQHEADMAEGTINALKLTISRMAGIDGRKILLLVSEKLPQIPGAEVYEYYSSSSSGHRDSEHSRGRAADDLLQVGPDAELPEGGGSRQRGVRQPEHLRRGRNGLRPELLRRVGRDDADGGHRPRPPDGRDDAAPSRRRDGRRRRHPAERFPGRSRRDGAGLEDLLLPRLPEPAEEGREAPDRDGPAEAARPDDPLPAPGRRPPPSSGSTSRSSRASSSATTRTRSTPRSRSAISSRGRRSRTSCRSPSGSPTRS